ncbi:hypothetical protein GC170_21415, partial [bacterium]|nr:hypothetical protein [bacterium]
MADAPDNETLNETSTPKTYLASVVCQVIRTRDLRDKGQIQLRWSANGRFFPPYLVPVDKLETCIADVRLAIQDIVTSLENAPEMLKSPGEIIDGVSLNTLIIELAKAGKSLYDRLLPKEDATQREIEKWLKMLAAEDRVDTVEIQIDDECADDLTKPLPTIPWNLLFDDKLIKPAELLARLNSGAVDDWGFFWGAKFDLSCGKNVNPFKADSPIDLETVTLVVMMDETILANLHQDTNTKVEFEDLLQRIDALRDPDSPAGKIVHLMHDMASLESFIEERNQTPDVLYWLSHAKPDSLFLEFLDGREGEEVTVDRLASTFAAAENPKRLVAFLNGCQTAEASIKGSFLNAFRKFDFCDGLIATERETLDVFAHRFGMEFLESFFIRQLPLGRILHNLRRSSLPLGLLYGTYCPPNIRIVRKSDMKAVKRSAPYRIAPELGASLRKLSAAALTTARETRLANATVKPPAPPQPWPDK